VPQAAIERLEPAMTNEPKDGHVIAAAVVSDVQAMVTLNLRDFPLEACQPFAIEPLHRCLPARPLCARCRRGHRGHPHEG